MAIKYDNCKDCYSRCEHAGKNREFVCVNGFSCKITKEKPNTNADRIRAMSDEELAEIIACPKGLFDRMDCFDDNRDCEDCALEWLKQPAEKDGI